MKYCTDVCTGTGKFKIFLYGSVRYRTYHILICAYLVWPILIKKYVIFAHYLCSYVRISRLQEWKWWNFSTKYYSFVQYHTVQYFTGSVILAYSHKNTVLGLFYSFLYLFFFSCIIGEQIIIIISSLNVFCLEQDKISRVPYLVIHWFRMNL